MAKNSLFALLLRSPWWISAVIALVLGLLGMALLPAQFKAVGAFIGLPFIVIGAMAGYRQWRLPSAARVAEVHEAVAAMAWPVFADLLEQGFRRDGYTVQRRKSGEVDFELERKGRRMLVCARRWKSARVGLEALRALQAAREASDASDALVVGLGLLTDTARPFAVEHRIDVWQAPDLARLLKGQRLDRPKSST